MSRDRTASVDLPVLPDAIAALAEDVSFSGADPLALAGRKVMAKHTQKLYAHLPGVISGDDPHDVHQMRVATRRLRACLESTAPAYRDKVVVSLRKRLRRLARALGEVRDRDVLLIRLHHDRDESESQRDAIEATIERVQAERDEAHAALLKELDRKRTARLLAELHAFLACPLEEVAAPDGDLPLLVRHYAGSAIWREYEQVRRFETALSNASSERLHELRIACKHLRYTLELYEPALGEEARQLIKGVTAMQEHLGDLHDTDVAIAYLESRNGDTSDDSQPDDGRQAADGGSPTRTSEDQADAPPAVMGDAAAGGGASGLILPEHAPQRSYLESRIEQRRVLLAGVEPLWAQLSSEQRRRKLAKLIAVL
jgi:CHAD domain-containing protein